MSLTVELCDNALVYMIEQAQDNNSLHTLEKVLLDRVVHNIQYSRHLQNPKYKFNFIPLLLELNQISTILKLLDKFPKLIDAILTSPRSLYLLFIQANRSDDTSFDFNTFSAQMGLYNWTFSHATTFELCYHGMVQSLIESKIPDDDGIDLLKSIGGMEIIYNAVSAKTNAQWRQFGESLQHGHQDINQLLRHHIGNYKDLVELKNKYLDVSGNAIKQQQQQQQKQPTPQEQKDQLKLSFLTSPNHTINTSTSLLNPNLFEFADDTNSVNFALVKGKTIPHFFPKNDLFFSSNLNILPLNSTPLQIQSWAARLQSLCGFTYLTRTTLPQDDSNIIHQTGFNPIIDTDDFLIEDTLAKPWAQWGYITPVRLNEIFDMMARLYVLSKQEFANTIMHFLTGLLLYNPHRMVIFFNHVLFALFIDCASEQAIKANDAVIKELNNPNNNPSTTISTSNNTNNANINVNTNDGVKTKQLFGISFLCDFLFPSFYSNSPKTISFIIKQLPQFNQQILLVDKIDILSAPKKTALLKPSALLLSRRRQNTTNPQTSTATSTMSSITGLNNINNATISTKLASVKPVQKREPRDVALALYKKYHSVLNSLWKLLGSASVSTIQYVVPRLIESGFDYYRKYNDNNNNNNNNNDVLSIYEIMIYQSILRPKLNENGTHVINNITTIQKIYPLLYYLPFFSTISNYFEKTFNTSLPLTQSPFLPNPGEDEPIIIIPPPVDDSAPLLTSSFDDVVGINTNTTQDHTTTTTTTTTTNNNNNPILTIHNFILLLDQCGYFDYNTPFTPNCLKQQPTLPTHPIYGTGMIDYLLFNYLFAYSGYENLVIDTHIYYQDVSLELLSNTPFKSTYNELYNNMHYSNNILNDNDNDKNNNNNNLTSATNILIDQDVNNNNNTTGTVRFCYSLLLHQILQQVYDFIDSRYIIFQQAFVERQRRINDRNNNDLVQLEGQHNGVLHPEEIEMLRQLVAGNPNNNELLVHLMFGQYTVNGLPGVRAVLDLIVPQNVHDNVIHGYNAMIAMDNVEIREQNGHHRRNMNDIDDDDDSDIDMDDDDDDDDDGIQPELELIPLDWLLVNRNNAQNAPNPADAVPVPIDGDDLVQDGNDNNNNNDKDDEKMTDMDEQEQQKKTKLSFYNVAYALLFQPSLFKVHPITTIVAAASSSSSLSSSSNQMKDGDHNSISGNNNNNNNHNNDNVAKSVETLQQYYKSLLLKLLFKTNVDKSNIQSNNNLMENNNNNNNNNNNIGTTQSSIDQYGNVWNINDYYTLLRNSLSQSSSLSSSSLVEKTSSIMTKTTILDVMSVLTKEQYNNVQNQEIFDLCDEYRLHTFLHLYVVHLYDEQQLQEQQDEEKMKMMKK